MRRNPRIRGRARIRRPRLCADHRAVKALSEAARGENRRQPARKPITGCSTNGLDHRRIEPALHRQVNRLPTKQARKELSGSSSSATTPASRHRSRTAGLSNAGGRNAGRPPDISVGNAIPSSASCDAAAKGEIAKSLGYLNAAGHPRSRRPQQRRKQLAREYLPPMSLASASWSSARQTTSDAS